MTDFLQVETSAELAFRTQRHVRRCIQGLEQPANDYERWALRLYRRQQFWATVRFMFGLSGDPPDWMFGP